MSRFLILAFALAVGSFGASLARSAGDPLPSVTHAFDAFNAHDFGEATISVEIWQVVGTSGDFVFVRPASNMNRVGSMLPKDWYSRPQ